MNANDLDALDELLAKATPGPPEEAEWDGPQMDGPRHGPPWTVSDYDSALVADCHTSREREDEVEDRGFYNARLLVALRNQAPALIRLARRALERPRTRRPITPSEEDMARPPLSVEHCSDGYVLVGRYIGELIPLSDTGDELTRAYETLRRAHRRRLPKVSWSVFVKRDPNAGMVFRYAFPCGEEGWSMHPRPVAIPTRDRAVVLLEKVRALGYVAVLRVKRGKLGDCADQHTKEPDR